MNPNDLTLYAGVANARTQVDTFHLGHGVVLSRTFAHLSAPFLAGFLPRPPRPSRRPNPANLALHPSEPRSFDIVAQLQLPEESSPLKKLDRVNTVWWLAVLLRLRATPRVTVVGLSSEPFGGDPRIWRGAGFWPAEAGPREVDLDPEAPAEIRQEDLEWIGRCWVPAASLADGSRKLQRAVRWFDRSCFALDAAEALQSLWSSLAALFLPNPADDGRRLVANLAAFLDIPEGERAAFARSAAELLEARAASMEGVTDDLERAVAGTWPLVKRSLVRIFESGYVPTLRELESGRLGPH